MKEDSHGTPARVKGLGRCIPLYGGEFENKRPDCHSDNGKARRGRRKLFTAGYGAKPSCRSRGYLCGGVENWHEGVPRQLPVGALRTAWSTSSKGISGTKRTVRRSPKSRRCVAVIDCYSCRSASCHSPLERDAARLWPFHSRTAIRSPATTRLFLSIENPSAVSLPLHIDSFPSSVIPSQFPLSHSTIPLTTDCFRRPAQIPPYPLPWTRTHTIYTHQRYIFHHSTVYPQCKTAGRPTKICRFLPI